MPQSRPWFPLVLSTSVTIAITAMSGCGDDVPIITDEGSTSSTTSSDSTNATLGTVDSSGTSSSTVDPDSTGSAPSCGDGLIAADEGCDDANTEDGDGCSATCTLEDGWQCDDQPSSCFVVCGDGLITGDETCDDDNAIGNDGCSAECVLEDGWACEGLPSECDTVCGDGFVVGDSCDDGNVESGDGCTAGCLIEVGFFCSGEPSECVATCGDGLVLGDEQCDDDSLAPGDGCDARCMVETGWSCEGQPSACMPGCGDGLIVGSEECDDLGLADGDGCSAMCTIEVGWSCMDEPSTCATECGDALIAGAEECDDDGIVAGDGCSATCQTEPGWLCTGEPSVCATDCGDGVMVGAEACDDGNIEEGDGCSFACEETFGWSCVGSPSLCTVTDPLDTIALGGFGGCVLTSLGEVGCFGDNTESEVGNGTDDVETFVPAFALDDAVAITAGEEFHCAIRAAGDVWCWGDNLDRAMGPLAAAGVDQPLPILVPGLPVSVAIEAGDDHVCVIDVIGDVWCWGDNSDRQLGQGGVSTTDSPDPVQVALPGGLAAIELGLGQDHSCAVLEDNTVACWGDDDNGQLGDGASGTDNGVATLVPGLAVINDVEGGEDHTCALDDLGQVRCWGDNIDGQLGIGSTVDNPSPQLVGLPAAAQAISLGDQFSCALLVDDSVYCWGEGTDFQLGSGDLVPILVPNQVLELPAVDLVDIEAGGRGACVISATHERWCWGYSEEGQLGIAPLSQLTPGPTSFSGPVTSLALDRPEYRGVLCGVLLDGTVECSGDGTLIASGTSGAAGYFTPLTRHLSVPTPLSLVSDVQDVRMGDSFICVRTTTDVQCWGDNISRQLGQGGASTVDILTPVSVVGLGAVDELELGTQFACVRIGGAVQCWGENSQSQTGEGTTTTDQSAPVPVMGLADAVALSLGESHACALRATGVVSCWGDDGVGQLGDDDGDTADSAVPVDVTGLPAGVTQIATGQDHSCALAGGEVYCWGEGQYGQLGQGSETDSDTALVVPGLAGIVHIALGYNYSCAVGGAGDMWCWGYALDGQLGDGGSLVTGLTEVTSPALFPGGGITQVVAGNSVTCVETVAGWGCMGFRSAGQLGNGTTVEPSVPTLMVFGP